MGSAASSPAEATPKKQSTPAPLSEAQRSPSNQKAAANGNAAGAANESPSRHQRRANGDVIELPPSMTEEEKTAARNRNGGDFHRRVDALYDLIDSAGDGRSDGYLTFAELQHFFQGSEEKALQYISQIDGYAGACVRARTIRWHLWLRILAFFVHPTHSLQWCCVACRQQRLCRHR
jgi:hypothetical protein